jgi:hypothetical protein
MIPLSIETTPLRKVARRKNCSLSHDHANGKVVEWRRKTYKYHSLILVKGEFILFHHRYVKLLYSSFLLHIIANTISTICNYNEKDGLRKIRDKKLDYFIYLAVQVITFYTTLSVHQNNI